MSKVYFTSLCSSKSDDWLLWDDKTGWDTPDPDITLCFQYTILNWIPFLYLLLTSVVYIPVLWWKSSLIYNKRAQFNLFKSILITFILLIHILNLSCTISENVNNLNPPLATYLQPILSILSSLLLIYLNRLTLLKGVHSSGVLFFYWLIQFLASLIILYSRFRRIDMTDKDDFRTVTATLEFVLVFILFLSNCFTDTAVFKNAEKSNFKDNLDETHPLLSFPSNEKMSMPKPCPKKEASFLSKITYLWLTNLMIKGYKKALAFDDLYALLDEDTCKTIIPKLESEWYREVERVENKNSKKKSIKKDRYVTNYETIKSEDDNEENIEINENNKFDSKTEKKKTFPKFWRALFHTIGYPYVLSGIFKLAYDLITFLQPQLLSLLIAFIESPNEHLWHGFIWAMCLFIISLIRTLIFQQFYHGCYVTGMRARTGVIGIIYRKALRLSSSSRKETTVGEIVNLMSVDAQKLQDAPSFLHFIWSCPITIAVAIYFLWQELGPSILAGVALMICLLPINGVIGARVKKLQAKQMKMKDNRIKLMSEILSGIKILKLYAWEDSFEEKIKSIREDECRVLRSATYLNAFSAVTWFVAPFLVALFTFVAFILSSPQNVLTANKAFVSLSLFNILNFPMTMLPGTIVYGIQAYVSLIRINKFLMGEELDVDNVEVSPPSEKPVKIVDGNFSWGRNEPQVLKDINIEIPERSLVAIVGTVGSGKTSLASALIGELYKMSGRVMCRGSVAYVPQQAWCQNASLQDNILFSKPMNMHRYNRIVEACALSEDLKIFAGGDQTEIGEKGVNLSGGQKQRISLARAVYQDCSIYILDDPLSAVDSHVGRHIFNEVIGPNGLLAGKTRILVTHGLTYLPKVDKIFVMKDGRISESGTFDEILNLNGSFSEFIRTYFEQEEEEGADEESEEEAIELKKKLKKKISHISSQNDTEGEHQLSHSNHILSVSKKSHRRTSSVRLSKSKSAIAEELEEENRKNKKKKLIEEESAEIGGVKFSVFFSYLRSCTFTLSFMVVFSYSLYMCCSVGANIFLSYWTESGHVNGTQIPESQGFYLGIYSSLGIGQALFVLIENFSLAYGTYLASRSLHNILLHSILKAPCSFFDTTPVGRILNRIGKDIDTVDINIPTSIRMWLMTAAGVIGAVFAISISSPYFMIALIPLALFYFLVQRFYIATTRQLKRIDSIKRSPIYSHFQESIVGASSIRAYRVSDQFIEKCDFMTDENQMAWYPNIISYRWLNSNLEVLGNLVILITSILATLTKDYIGGGYAGLSISYSLQITGALNFVIRMTCDLETYTIAVERIKEYVEIESEAAYRIEETKPLPNWPTHGKIEFINYSVRYRPGLNLVLRNLNFKVDSGEKIGIVGRTGAGKSSLTLALFRLIEPAEGSILIDDVDICKLGLHDFRSKITIIPQDPVLFSGTLRMNLDPFGQHSDGELWSALEMSFLKPFVTKTVDGLDYVVSEGGENLSVGQRQLLCLARALLKKTKVLVLDEATAAVDFETDEMIQSTIQQQFKTCTVLTIAHRLNTIMDYDRILVLDNGRIKELDSPRNLLENHQSLFYSMAQNAGII